MLGVSVVRCDLYKIILFRQSFHTNNIAITILGVFFVETYFGQNYLVLDIICAVLANGAEISDMKRYL